MSPTWLKELGAVRPMAPCGENKLVLGKWCNGHYPISWTEGKASREWDGYNRKWKKTTNDEWRLFGIKCEPLTKKDVERIVAAVDHE